MTFATPRPYVPTQLDTTVDLSTNTTLNTPRPKPSWFLLLVCGCLPWRDDATDLASRTPGDESYETAEGTPGWREREKREEQRGSKRKIE